MQADLVLTNAKVITVDSDFTIKDAVAIKAGRIVAVGSHAEVSPFIGSTTSVLDLKGKPVLPGINEAHLHSVFFGSTRPPLAIDLTFPAIKSIQEMVDALRVEAEKTPPNVWIHGFGWDMGSLEECRHNPDRLPRRSDLDAVSPDNPVAFTDFSGHTLLVNSKALELAEITEDTPDPDGGVIERNPGTGKLTGIFKELPAQALVGRVVPLLTREEKKQAIRTALNHLHANGVTSYTDAALGPGGDLFDGGAMGAECIEVYRDLLNTGELNARVTILLLFGEYGSLTFKDLKEGIQNYKAPADLDREWLQIPGIKIFADGIPPTKTAWMHEAYVGGEYGELVIPGETDEDKYNELVDMIVHSHVNGYQVGVHTCGDRAIDAAMDGFVKAHQTKKGQDLRHYLIHADFISPETAERAYTYSCGVSTQPTIKALTADFVPQLIGEKRSAYQFPLRTIMDKGMNLTGSSDAPVTYPNWRLGVQAAVLRESLGSGQVSGPQECITVEEAIRMYTINGAWQDHMEDIKGSIETGKLADFCILEEDILTVDPHKIGDIQVLMTIVGGNIVYDQNGNVIDS